MVTTVTMVALPSLPSACARLPSAALLTLLEPPGRRVPSLPHRSILAGVGLCSTSTGLAWAREGKELVSTTDPVSQSIVAMVIAMVNWVQIARVVYTETTALAEREFVLATVGFGAGSWRISSSP